MSDEHEAIIPEAVEAGVQDWDAAAAEADTKGRSQLSAVLKRLAARRVVGPGQPADAGLNGLGVVMQLGGGTFFCISLAALLGGLVGPVPSIFMLLGVLGVARSWIHFSAGRALMVGAIDGLKPLRRYVVVGVLHAVAVAGLLSSMGKGGLAGPLAGFFTLAAWPLTLAWFSMRPSVKAVRKLSLERPDRIVPEDRGIQGVAALMTVLGLSGFIGLALIGWLLVEASQSLSSMERMHPGMDAPGLPITLYLAVGILLIRSGIHAAGGLVSLWRPDAFRFRVAAGRYFAVGVLSCVAVVLQTVLSDGFNIVLLIVLLPLMGCLMVWPVVVRSFADHCLPMIDWDDGDDLPPVGVAHDGGLSTIACFLLAGGVLGVVSRVGFGLLGGFGGSSVVDSSGPLWLHLGSHAFAVWVSVVFLSGSGRARLAAILYCTLSAGVAVYSLIELRGLSELSGALPAGAVLAAFAMVIFPLVLPLVALAAAYSPRPSTELGVEAFD